MEQGEKQGQDPGALKSDAPPLASPFLCTDTLNHLFLTYGPRANCVPQEHGTSSTRLQGKKIIVFSQHTAEETTPPPSPPPHRLPEMVEN